MARSQNGWTANDPSTVSRRPVPGTQVGLTVRNGAPGDLLLEVAAQFDKHVQDIDNARGSLDDWGYAERPIRGGTSLSNHASGTAVDLNATRWPLGKPASVNLTAAQITTVRCIVAATGGVVRWGGDYTGRKDPMHFELADRTTHADCERALRALGCTPIGTPTPDKRWPELHRGDRRPEVGVIQRFLGIEDDNIFGEATENAVKRYQRIRAVPVTGVVDATTWKQTGL